MTAAITATGALLAYAGLIWLANQYSQRSGWQPPPGSAGANPALRRNVAIVLGALAVVGCSAGTSLWVNDWLARLLIVGQAVLLAAAGASDLRRFHLPLPLTLTGIAVALFTVTQTHMPVLYFSFALAWALVVIVLHAALSRGSMQLGDHIATIWIALALPFNGLLAVLTGDLANVAIARVKSLTGKKVAAAGAWLVVAAALIGVPPYYAWFKSAMPVTEAPAQPAAVASSVRALAAGQTYLPPLADSAAIRQHDQLVTALYIITERASQYTAAVALANTRAGRINAASREAGNVAQLAALSNRLAPGSGVGAVLNELATALSTYDVDAVRSASQRLADMRRQLSTSGAAGSQNDNGPTLQNSNN